MARTRVRASGETFAGSGRVTGILGLVIVAGFVSLDLFQLGSIPLPVVSGALLLGVLMWTTMLRPQVSTSDGSLVLRNGFETVFVPLAAVEDLSVRQVLVVRTARRRYVSSGTGRSVRQALRADGPATPQQPVRPSLGPAFGGENPSQVEPGMAYADWVELRLRDLVQEDRERRGIRSFSEQAAELADDVVRRPALPELVALVATATVFVIAVIVALV